MKYYRLVTARNRAHAYCQIIQRRRCRHCRRGLRRHVHAASAARSRHVGARVRGRQRRRRHLVLEPLSRRPLRCREHAVFLLVLAGTAAGMAVERAVRLAAGDPALRQPCRRSLRPAPRHPVRHAGDDGALRPGDAPLGHPHRPRRSGVGASLRDGHRLSFHRARAGSSRDRALCRQDLSHRPLAA